LSETQNHARAGAVDLLLDVACIESATVTVTKPFSENNNENENEVFRVYKYLISGVPRNVTVEEIKKFAGCYRVQRIIRRANGGKSPTETCILTYMTKS